MFDKIDIIWDDNEGRFFIRGPLVDPIYEVSIPRTILVKIEPIMEPVSELAKLKEVTELKDILGLVDVPIKKPEFTQEFDLKALIGTGEVTLASAIFKVDTEGETSLIITLEIEGEKPIFTYAYSKYEDYIFTDIDFIEVMNDEFSIPYTLLETVFFELRYAFQDL